jgi:superfamily II DNA or RNA helicase
MNLSLFEREVAQSKAMRPLRPRQAQAYEDSRRAIAEGHKHHILQAHTGWGKTLWSAHVIASALRKGRRPLFTCPAISLVEQTLKAFELEGIHDIGVMQAQHSRTDHRATVQIACVPTLLRRQLPQVDLVLVDECHEQSDGLNELLAGAWKDVIVIGLSATPWARGMGLRWSKLIIGGTIQDAISDGFARRFPIFGPEHDIDREGIGTERGEFKESGSAAAMSDKTIVGDVLNEWQERSTREKTFAFCVNRDHAKTQMEAFADAGIPFGYIDANVPAGESDNERGTRRYIFAQMRHGEIAGIASVGCLIRGVDEIVTTILDLQPTMSEIRHCQKWGRMRTGDPSATYVGLDHAGNNAKLGMFWDIYHDTLDTREPGERGDAYKDDYKPAKPRKCPKCHNLVPPGVRACPACKERLPLHPGIVTKDGRLVEIGSGPKLTKEHQAWYSELIHIARRSGFKEGWAAMQFKERFGLWPDGLKNRAKTETSDEVKAFVREQRRRFLESRKSA